MISLFDADVGDSSDSEDVDYVPSKADADLSEASDVCDELVASEGDEDSEEILTKSSKKRKISKRKLLMKEPSGENAKCVFERKGDTHTKTSQTEKVKADDVWKSFLEEVNGEKERKKEDVISSQESSKSVCLSHASESENNSLAAKNEITDQANENSKIFEFAGETVTVKDDTIINTVKISTDSVSPHNLFTKAADDKPTDAPKINSKRKSGLGSVLGTIMNKKQKLTTLQKTLIDWKTYKKDQGIEDEIEQFNKGKGGFIARQRFLQRSDLRSFEIEKETRLSKVKKH